MPCKKCDMNAHEISCHFMSQIDSLVQIYTNFHEFSMSFIQLLFVFHVETWHEFWTSSSHGISMAFARKMMGFSSDLSHFRPNCRPKVMRKSMLHLLQGNIRPMRRFLRSVCHGKRILCNSRWFVRMERWI